MHSHPTLPLKGSVQLWEVEQKMAGFPATLPRLERLAWLSERCLRGNDPRRGHSSQEVRALTEASSGGFVLQSPSSGIVHLLKFCGLCYKQQQTQQPARCLKPDPVTVQSSSTQVSLSLKHARSELEAFASHLSILCCGIFTQTHTVSKKKCRFTNFSCLSFRSRINSYW